MAANKYQTIRMNIHITGTRNGVDWPYAGGTIELPWSEAIQLAAAGYGSLVGEPREEHAPTEAIETATITTERKTRKTKRG
jgi:hypothetical protein